MKSEEITELKSARDLAMRNAAKARKPECGYFGVIAQTLDACLPSIEAQQETITHLTKRVEELEEERVSILKHKRAIMKAAKFHIPYKKYKHFTDLINELMGKAD